MVELGVLTATPSLGIYKELVAWGGEVGARVQIWDATRTVVKVPGTVLSEGNPLNLNNVRVFLPRVGNWRPESLLAIASGLERQGCVPFNSPEAIRLGRDHLRTVEQLALGGIPHPPTLVGSDPEVVAQAASAWGFPVVVKSRRSRQGVGVIRCGSLSELEAVLDALWRLGEEVVVQRFCPPGGESFRALVLQGSVLGVTRHRARDGEFRTNAARGGQVEPWPAEERLCQLAVAAAAATGLAFCGVDLWYDGDTLVVGEVNPTPGWKHFAQASGIPVGRRVLEAMVAVAKGVR